MIVQSCAARHTLSDAERRGITTLLPPAPTRVICRACIGGQLVVTPEQVCFGQVALGAVVHRSVRLLNASCDVARFSISRPAPPLRCGVWRRTLALALAIMPAAQPRCIAAAVPAE